tara:strand:+ start:87 stop:320 length:234 start_codon:yes stop_codon:yes gene_type:complete
VIEVTIKFTQDELELLIEVLERTPHNNTLENELRNQLRTIRSNIEIKKNQMAEDSKNKPNEEIKFISANPTSAEHKE